MFAQNNHAIMYTIQQVEIFVCELAHITNWSNDQCEQHADERKDQKVLKCAEHFTRDLPTGQFIQPDLRQDDESVDNLRS